MKLTLKIQESTSPQLGRFRDLYRNSRGEMFAVVEGLIRCVPMEQAAKIWPRGTAPVHDRLEAKR